MLKTTTQTIQTVVNTADPMDWETYHFTAKQSRNFCFRSKVTLTKISLAALITVGKTKKSTLERGSKPHYLQGTMSALGYSNPCAFLCHVESSFSRTSGKEFEGSNIFALHTKC